MKSGVVRLADRRSRIASGLRDEHALAFEELHHVREPGPCLQVRHHERFRAAHAFRVGLHHAEVGADVGAEVLDQLLAAFARIDSAVGV